MKDVELLGIVSFLVMMENGEGLGSKAPSYILEKYRLIKDVPYAWSALDIHNQRKVIEWGKKWGVDFEKLIEQIGKDYNDIPRVEFREKYFIK